MLADNLYCPRCSDIKNQKFVYCQSLDHDITGLLEIGMCNKCNAVIKRYVGRSRQNLEHIFYYNKPNYSVYFTVIFEYLIPYFNWLPYIRFFMSESYKNNISLPIEIGYLSSLKFHEYLDELDKLTLLL